ncbi:MAG TPA: arginine decarboxylase, pyruvoyl-dependent [Candidatus Nitrosocosmicus sp.]
MDVLKNILNKMSIVAGKFFFTKGVGVHEKYMRAFENALREAGIQTLNLVRISSIIPPGCKKITREEGIKLLKPGQIAFAVMAETQTNEPGQIISAGIGMAQPKDETIHGYLTELEESIGHTEEDVKRDVEEMALENLVTEWGYQFDAETVLKKGKKEYTIHDQEIMVDSIVECAEGKPGNQFTVVITAAVMIY